LPVWNTVIGIVFDIPDKGFASAVVIIVGKMSDYIVFHYGNSVVCEISMASPHVDIQISLFCMLTSINRPDFLVPMPYPL